MFERVLDILETQARRHPDRAAVKFKTEVFTYARLYDETRVLAQALLHSGLRRGDRIAVMSTPRPEFLTSFLAASSIGVIWIGLHPQYRVRDLAQILKSAAPHLVLCLSSYEGVDLSVVVGEALDAVGIDTPVTALENAALLLGARPAAPGAIAADDWRPIAAEIRKDDPAIIVYTSGSSGTPKGVVLSQFCLAWGGAMQARHFAIAEPVMICNFPINHVASVADVCCSTLAAAGTIVFQEKFDSEAVLSAVAEHRVSIVGGVPTMLQMILESPQLASADLSSVQLVFWGGAHMPTATLRRLSALGKPLMTGYGMTETTVQVSFTERLFDGRLDEGAVGVPDEDCAIAVVDEAGRALPANAVGEILIRAPCIMSGYWGEGGKLDRSVFHSDGFMRTGDLGMLKQDGALVLMGRSSEMFKSGGYRIHPAEIEATIAAHPDVQLCAVVPTLDARFGQVSTAYVQPKPGRAIEAVTLDDFCRRNIARYKVPKRFVVMQRLPTLAVGKVDKKRLASERTDA